jgi:hypothetical protein
MRTLSFIRRRSAGLILLALVFNNCHEVCADNLPAEYSASTSGAVVRDAAEQEQIKPENPPVTADDVWLISTRHLGYSSSPEKSPFDLRISHFSDAGDWIDSDLNELLDGGSRKTIIYLHGNRIGFDEAIRRAWKAFAVLKRDSHAQPLRLIIWSWPSDQVHGQLRDFRYKASRTNVEGQYLGWFLSRLNVETHISLIGYSYGARIATGALHVLGGGTLRGQSSPLAVANGDRRPIKVVLIAAALHSHWLAPTGYHRHFSSVADRVLVFYNSRDPILQRYRLLVKRGRPMALGFAGAWGLDDDLADRTEQYDVSCSVGKTHSESAFLSSSTVVEGLQQLVQLNAVQEKAIQPASVTLDIGR